MGLVFLSDLVGLMALLVRLYLLGLSNQLDPDHLTAPVSLVFQ